MLTYLVFAGDDCYPLRGAGDFQGAYSDPAKALLDGAALQRDWTQVVEFDGETMVVVAETEDGKVTVYPERMRHVATLSLGGES